MNIIDWFFIGAVCLAPLPLLFLLIGLMTPPRAHGAARPEDNPDKIRKKFTALADPYC